MSASLFTPRLVYTQVNGKAKDRPQARIRFQSPESGHNNIALLCPVTQLPNALVHHNRQRTR